MRLLRKWKKVRCNSTLDFHHVLRDVAIARLAVKQNVGQGSPNSLARPDKWSRLQESLWGSILNGRPAEQVGDPIMLFHPVFSAFVQNIESNDPLPDQAYINFPNT